MPATLRGWLAGLALGIWLTAAHPVGAADEPAASPSSPPGQTVPTAADKPKNTRTESAPEEEVRPAAKPPAPSPAVPRTRRPFRPSEEIHVDKAVDFPADI